MGRGRRPRPPPLIGLMILTCLAGWGGVLWEVEGKRVVAAWGKSATNAGLARAAGNRMPAKKLVVFPIWPRAQAIPLGAAGPAALLKA